MSEDVQYLLEMYAKMFAACSPIAAVALCISMTPSNTPQERWKLACKACHVAFGLLLICAFFGARLLDLLGVDMNAFRIAGGLVLGMMGFDLLKCEFSDENTADPKQKGRTRAKDIIVTPLAFPIIAGPGAISSLMIVKSEACNDVQTVFAYVNVVLLMLTLYGLFYLASVCSKLLSPAFIQISSRLCGLIVLAMSAQFLASGIVGFFK
ncbi:MAG: MarC family protein [Puniceicoccales bacterium]|jgi:multiple antibiotic resistance protein|nr:MarC family protein [Puniceicoccales bacterium]